MDNISNIVNRLVEKFPNPRSDAQMQSRRIIRILGTQSYEYSETNLDTIQKIILMRIGNHGNDESSIKNKRLMSLLNIFKKSKLFINKPYR